VVVVSRGDPVLFGKALAIFIVGVGAGGDDGAAVGPNRGAVPDLGDHAAADEPDPHRPAPDRNSAHRFPGTHERRFRFMAGAEDG
jgi:hypothetical protein